MSFKIFVAEDGTRRVELAIAGTTPATNPAHPRYGVLPARHVYRSFRSAMIDAPGGSAVPDAFIAEWPAAPRYFPLRFTRTWQLRENCSFHFPSHSACVENTAGMGLLRKRLSAHGVIYLSQAPATPVPAPSEVVVSVIGGMRFLEQFSKRMVHLIKTRRVLSLFYSLNAEGFFLVKVHPFREKL